MTTWRSYGHLNRYKQLKNEGRELLGREITITEKRDGENVSIWLDEKSLPHISSHNMEEADSSIVSRLNATPEANKIIDLLRTEHSEFDKNYIVYGELLKAVGPTRIEPRRKHTHWVLFDVWDSDAQKFLNYVTIYQLGYHYKIPVVRALANIHTSSLDGLEKSKQEWLSWCKRHRREGFVGKAYYGEEQVFFKEKIDVPELESLSRVKKEQIQYPQMPQETISRALQHAFDEVTEPNWKDVKITMPVVAKHLSVEAREHNYSVPRNMYNLYLDAKIEELKVAKS